MQSVSSQWYQVLTLPACPDPNLVCFSGGVWWLNRNTSLGGVAVESVHSSSGDCWGAERGGGRESPAPLQY